MKQQRLFLLKEIPKNYSEIISKKNFVFVVPFAFFRDKNTSFLVIHHPLAPALTYIMSAYKDKAGFYFLSIVTDGDLWMPRDWPRLKSWVNGVRKEW